MLFNATDSLKKTTKAFILLNWVLKQCRQNINHCNHAS